MGEKEDGNHITNPGLEGRAAFNEAMERLAGLEAYITTTEERSIQALLGDLHAESAYVACSSTSVTVAPGERQIPDQNRLSISLHRRLETINEDRDEPPTEGVTFSDGEATFDRLDDVGVAMVLSELTHTLPAETMVWLHAVIETANHSYDRSFMSLVVNNVIDSAPSTVPVLRLKDKQLYKPATKDSPRIIASWSEPNEAYLAQRSRFDRVFVLRAVRVTDENAGITYLHNTFDDGSEALVAEAADTETRRRLAEVGYETYLPREWDTPTRDIHMLGTHEVSDAALKHFAKLIQTALVAPE